jgi:hypothetical protein
MADPTIEVLDAPTKTSDCGGARSRVKWKMGGKNGWIIQHVVFAKDRKSCAGAKLEPVGFVGEYWEAWQVKAGAVKIGDTDAEHQSDTFQIADQGNDTKGKASIVGEVKFFEDYKLDMPPWEKNKIPLAGALPTTSAAPPGWDAAGALEHTLRSAWVCCEGRKENVVTGTPMPEPPEKPGTPKPAKNILKSIHGTPPWSRIGPRQRRPRQDVETTMRRLARAGLGDLREAVAQYDEFAADREGLAAMSRLFVLNRYVFRLPDRLPLGELPFFGGWDGVLADEETLAPLWPWTLRDGQKRLTGTFRGYAGDRYLALAEFDYFTERFERYRPPKS